MTETTNSEKPFEKGEIIIWCAEKYTVEANHGSYGEVTDVIDGKFYDNFKWNLLEDSRRVIQSDENN